MTISGSTLVLVADTAQVLATLPARRLGDNAEERRDRLVETADRDDFTAARLLASLAHRALAGDAFEAEEIVQRCDTCGGPHGRPLPTAAGIRLSWSHAHGRVAAAAGRGRLGVDLETRAAVTDDLLAVALSPAERRAVTAAADRDTAFLLAWTAKEAAVKAGAADLDGFPRLTVLADDGTLLPRRGGLGLEARVGDGLVAALASEEPGLWRGIDGSGRPVPVDVGTVGGAA